MFNDSILFWEGQIRLILEFSLLWFIFYKTLQVLYRANFVPYLLFFLFLLGIYLVAYFLQLELLLWILYSLAPLFVIGFIIVFQQDIRKIFFQLPFYLVKENRPSMGEIYLISTALDYLVKIKKGALIVLGRKMDLSIYADKGITLNADISSNLLITLFSHSHVLHDGAVILQNNQIVSAACFLPLSETQPIKQYLGTRHLAAIGMSEETDAIVIILSEEYSSISLAVEGQIYYDISLEQLEIYLKRLLDLKDRSLTREGLNEKTQIFF